MKTYYRPIPILDPASADSALRLCGGWCFFDKIECITREAPARIIAAEDAPADILDRLTLARAPVAGLSLDQMRLMGILNVTPDSFSDGGRHSDPAAAAQQARALVEAGADILDIGGESTRPGAVEIPVATEIDRVVPVIEAIRSNALATKISIDTRKAPVAAAALAAGGDIINDVSAFRFDPDIAPLAAQHHAPVILMHSRGNPDDMQNQTDYDSALLDVYDALEAAVAQAEKAGIPRKAILVDPGIGFAKNDTQNAALLGRISLFHTLGCAILLGVSRKGFIGRVANISEPDKRDAASAALGLWAYGQGVQMLRVHDILGHKQALDLWQKTSAR